MGIGDRIRLRRRLLGMSQEELGEKVGRHYNTVSSWERTGNVPMEMIPAVADALDTTVGYLRAGDVNGHSRNRKPSWVETKSQAADWLGAVMRSGMGWDLIDVLAAIGSFFDEEHRLAMTSKEALIEETNLDEDLIESVWDDVLASEWLEVAPRVKWGFKLIFPDE